MKEEFICPICGEPTSVYMGNARKDRLCRKHGKMANAGEIEQCPDCGKWHENGKICECKTAKTVKLTDTNNELTCLICGEPSNGKHFCLDCYRRYKNKEILLKIRKCEFPCGEPLDESYEGVYECNDGHIVKSMSEQAIDNYLFEHAIFHGYELPFDIETDKPIKPDFCLKNYLGEGKDVYIEYFGLKGNPKYDEETAYKMKHYRENKITLICMYPATDSKNFNFALKKKLNKNRIKENEINYYEE